MPMVSMSVMPGYESPTFIMIRRRARPIATFTCEIEPGPSAQTPWFMPISSAIGPDTSTMGAWGPVDIAQVRSPIDGSRMHSIIAMITGMVSGWHPAMTALAAILRDGADPEARGEEPDHVVAAHGRRPRSWPRPCFASAG